jgi:hypothetical protein
MKAACLLRHVSCARVRSGCGLHCALSSVGQSATASRLLVGHVAFEVGEVHGGKVKLEETVVPCGIAAGLEPVLVLINDQEFTKTANCWGVQNNNKGTNTNRVVVLRKARS